MKRFVCLAVLLCVFGVGCNDRPGGDGKGVENLTIEGVVAKVEAMPHHYESDVGYMITFEDGRVVYLWEDDFIPFKPVWKIGQHHSIRYDRRNRITDIDN